MPAAFNVADREFIVALAARYRVPAISLNAILLSRRTDCFWYRLCRGGSPGGRVYGPNPQGREAARPTRTSSDEVSSYHQSQDRQSLGLEVPLLFQQFADELIE